MRFLLFLALLTHAAAFAPALSAQSPKTPGLDLHGDPLPPGVVARLGSVRFQAPEHVDALALSPDGSTLALKNRTREGKGLQVAFMDMATGKILRELDEVEVHDNHLQFSPDGRSLVFGGWSDISFHDVATGKLAWSVKMSGDSAFAFSHDGKRLAFQPRVYVKDAPVHVWDTTARKQVAVLPGRGAQCRDLVFSHDGKRLLLWSIVPAKVSEKSITVGSGSKEALACIDLASGKIVGEMHAEYGQSVALSPDGETVAVENAERSSLRVVHLPSGDERTTIAVKQAKFAFLPDGKRLLTLDADGRASLWDAALGSKVRDLEGDLIHAGHSIVGFSRSGGTIVVAEGGWDSAQSFVVWNADTGQRVKRSAGHAGAVTCLAYAPDGKQLASGGLDRTVRLWNPATGAHLRLLASHAQQLTAVAFSPDGSLLASSSKDGLVRLTRVADGKSLADLVGPDRGAAALAFSTDGRTLFAGGHSPEVFAWELPNAKEIVRFRTGDEGSVAALTRGGALGLSINDEAREGLFPERMQLWSTSRKVPIASFPLRVAREDMSGNVRCTAAACSPDDRMVASSQVTAKHAIRAFFDTPLLRLWERASGQQIRELAPTTTEVLAFSANGRLLASGTAGQSGRMRVGYGKGIDFWDVATGRKVAALADSPTLIAFSPLGDQLATAGRDQVIQVREAPTIPAVKQAKATPPPQRDAWWNALGGGAKEAYEAVAQMIDAPDDAVKLLKERVRPVQAQDAATVATLIAKLDSVRFTERDQAYHALAKMGDGAIGPVKAALAEKVSIEVKGRLELLIRLGEATSNASLRNHRAVAALEWIGTPGARAALRELADGAPEARLTTDALAAWDRSDPKR